MELELPGKLALASEGVQRYRGALLICLLASLPAGWAYQAAQPATFDEIAKKAAQARQASRLDEAIGLYQQALALRPKWNEGWWYLGTIYYDLGRYSEAANPLRILVALAPKSGQGFGLLGLAEFALHDYRMALIHLERARALDFSGNEQIAADALYHNALLLVHSGQFDAAQNVLIWFARQGKNTPAILQVMGLAVLRLPYWPSELPSKDSELVRKAGLALWYQDARRPVEAAKAFEDLAATYAQMPNVHYAYGSFLLNDRPDDALKQFRRELEISPGHVFARLQLAFEYLKRDDADGALPLAQEAVKLDPDAFQTHLALGRALAKKRDLAGGIRHLEIAVKLAADSPESRYALASAYAQAGRKQEAEQQRKEFLRLNAERPK